MPPRALVCMKRQHVSPPLAFAKGLHNLHLVLLAVIAQHVNNGRLHKNVGDFDGFLI